MSKLRVVRTGQLDAHGLINPHPISLFLGNTEIFTHNNISRRMMPRITAGSNAAANRRLMTNHIRNRLNNHELLNRSQITNTRQKMYAFVDHIIHAREKRSEYRLVQAIARELRYSEELAQINRNIKAAKNQGNGIQQRILEIQRNVVRERKRQNSTANTEHSKQVAAWRWIRESVLPNIIGRPNNNNNGTF
jgi:hypothetical protein